MSERDINRWQDTITPRDLSKPWTIGSGGSWDMANVQPIPDSMLAELAKLYHSHGCPWNCRSLPLSASDREYMYLLYFSMQGLVARMRLAEKAAADLRAANAALVNALEWTRLYVRDASQRSVGQGIREEAARRLALIDAAIAKANGDAS